MVSAPCSEHLGWTLLQLGLLVATSDPVGNDHCWCRADVVPRLSYCAVEGVLKDLIAASPVSMAAAAANSLGQRMKKSISGLKLDMQAGASPSGSCMSKRLVPLARHAIE